MVFQDVKGDGEFEGVEVDLEEKDGVISVRKNGH